MARNAYCQTCKMYTDLVNDHCPKCNREIPPAPTRIVMGWIFIFAALLVIFFFMFVFNSSIDANGLGRVTNLSLSAFRQNGIMIGLTLWISGLLCILIPAGKD